MRAPSPFHTTWQAADVARLATHSLVSEVTLTPKPGLVDARTNGAHTDMDVTTFLASAEALAPHFVTYARLGIAHGAAPITPKFVAALRCVGRVAETDMFDATVGVNTHKGANYSFSLILAATGIELASGRALPFDAATSARVLARAAAIGQEILNEDIACLHERVAAGCELSHGERLFLEQGVAGVRGESAQGYPMLARVLLPYLRTRRGEDANDTLLRAMVLLMSELEDTNLLHRGGAEGLAWTQGQAWALRGAVRDDPCAGLAPDDLVRSLSLLDAELTRRNLSPGGTADLLSLGIYFATLEGLLNA